MSTDTWLQRLNQNWPAGVPHLLMTGQKCPLCTSSEFMEGDDSGYDRVLRLFGLHPIRCSNCWRRYYRFGKWRRPA